MGKVTIDDISRETGLSRGTVSRAMNDRPDISEKTKELVKAACAKLNYTPSFAARSLATGRYFTLAVLIANAADALAFDIIRGAAQRADTARYALHVVVLPGGPATASRIRALAAERIDGVVATTALLREQVTLLSQTLGQRPIVACCELPPAACDILTPDFAEAGRLAARTLIATRPKSILHIRRPGMPADEAHRAGFADACRAAHVDASRIRYAANDLHAGSDARARTFADADAIATADLSLAHAAVLSAAFAGKRAGRDVSVLGFGPALPGRTGAAILSIIDPGGVEIGRRAIETLVARVDRTRHDAPQTIRVAPTLVAGGTLVA